MHEPCSGIRIHQHFDAGLDFCVVLTEMCIRDRDIINGSTLKFVMGKKPNKNFGKAPANRPVVLNKIRKKRLPGYALSNRSV